VYLKKIAGRKVSLSIVLEISSAIGVVNKLDLVLGIFWRSLCGNCNSYIIYNEILQKGRCPFAF
jgi:hypothetical protein